MVPRPSLASEGGTTPHSRLQLPLNLLLRSGNSFLTEQRIALVIQISSGVFTECLFATAWWLKTGWYLAHENIEAGTLCDFIEEKSGI